MPRIPHSVLLQAYNISPLLPLILRSTRDLQSAQNELRWLVEYVQETVKVKSPLDFPEQRSALLKLCRRRERGEPLQYILGSQPFGELDIKCRPGVLIPRPETESYTIHLAKLILQERIPGIEYEKHRKGSVAKENMPLEIIDICSGSGCISLLLQAILFNGFNIATTGVDISHQAVRLARENRKTTLGTAYKKQTHFLEADIFEKTFEAKQCDIVVANPPYISSQEFFTDTNRSVRNWEPKLALVPRITQGEQTVDTDIFYRRIIELNKDGFKSKMLLMEVGGDAQARRVVTVAIEILGNQNRVEIWNDSPGDPRARVIDVAIPEQRRSEFGGKVKLGIGAKGVGHHRAVIIYGSAVPKQRRKMFQYQLSSNTGETACQILTN